MSVSGGCIVASLQWQLKTRQKKSKQPRTSLWNLFNAEIFILSSEHCDGIDNAVNVKMQHICSLVFCIAHKIRQLNRTHISNWVRKIFGVQFRLFHLCVHQFTVLNIQRQNCREKNRAHCTLRIWAKTILRRFCCLFVCVCLPCQLARFSGHISNRSCMASTSTRARKKHTLHVQYWLTKSTSLLCLFFFASHKTKSARKSNDKTLKQRSSTSPTARLEIALRSSVLYVVIVCLLWI